MKIYKIPNSEQYIKISDKVINKLNKYKQLNNQSENGGILFAEFKLPEIYISDISSPYHKDTRETFLFVPNKKHQKKVIKTKYMKGLHFVGEWHTHPQKQPNPSQLDINSMKDSFLKSNHELNYFIMLILGNSNDFNNTWISIHNGESYKKL
jgi:integrative and conjugative element protein (TIGR02256 family)